MNNALAATRRIGLAIVAFLVLASTGHAADFSAWAKTTSLTFSGYSKPETLTDFPVLVVLSTDISGFSYSDFQSPAHDDLRFTDEAGTELSYEVESWDPAGKSYVWVKLPSLVNSATKIYAFWGMAGQTAPAYTTNGSTWTSSYVAVYHLATVGSSLSAADATRVNNGTVVGDPAATAGKVDGGGSFLTGGNNNISIPDSPSTRITGKLTLSAWINPTSINATYPGEIIEKRNDDASEMNYGMWLWNDGTLNFHFFDSDYRIFNSTGTVSLSTWTYVTIVVDESAPTKLSMYLNGSLDSTPAYTGSMVSRTSPLHIGSGPYGDSYQFKGSLDEVRISNVAQSPNWVWACYMNQASNSDFVTVTAVADGGKPTISTTAASGIGTASATLHGSLSSTGKTETAVFVYWGATDQGTNATWDHSAVFPGSAGPGAYSTNVTLDTPAVTYYYRYCATNSSGIAWASNSAHFIAGEVTVQATDAAASEVGPDQGTFTVYRPVTATQELLTVNYVLTGSAVNGVDYTPLLGGTLTIPAGESSKTITITPVADLNTTEGTETVHLTLVNGLYVIGTPAEAEILIADNIGPVFIAADSVNDFSDVQGSNNWYYGYYDNDVMGGTFVQLGFYVTPGYWVRLPDTPPSWPGSMPLLAATSAYPGNVTPKYPVRRWVSTVSGPIVISGEWGDLDPAGGDGAICSIRTNGVVIASYDFPNGGAIINYAITTTVAVAETLDFVVDPRNNYDGDPTAFTAVIAALQQAPVIVNSSATNVTLVSATLQGVLSRTGVSEPTVLVYWGTTDQGTNANLWAHTNVFVGPAVPGTYSTNVTLATPAVTYYYRYCATNSGGIFWASNSAHFIAGEVTVQATDDAASEVGPDPGTFTVYRPVTATQDLLTINYVITGTASNGVDYTPLLSGTLTIPAGESSKTITITPLVDANTTEGTETVHLTLVDGPYLIGVPAEAEISIADNTSIPLNNYWIGDIGTWSDGANWSDGIAPVGGQVVVVTNGTILLDQATAPLASFTITNATLTFTNWATALNATEVQIRNNVVLTHGECNTTSDMTNHVWIVASNLTIDAGGSIDVTGKGYVTGPGVYGAQRAGAAYGGKGGYCGGVGGVSYGSPWAPLDPGSGAEGSHRGGGAVLVQASGHVLMNGLIKANGHEPPTGWSGEGSGGSVYMVCRTFAGTNSLITARGTDGGWESSGGGGGRIAIYYDAAAQQALPRPTVRIDAGGGAIGGGSVGGATPGEMGSIYLSDGQLIPTVLDNWNGQLYGQTNWSWPAVTMNLSAIRVGGPYGDRTNAVISCAGNLLLTNNSLLELYSGPTNAAWTNYGGGLYVAGNLTVATGCWITVDSDPVSGGSILIRATDVVIEGTPGGINADARGFNYPYGPGLGLVSRQGGAYGGAGGGAALNTCTYGDSNAPVSPGSPGNAGWKGAGRGGGVIRIEAERNVLVNGSLSANGQEVGGWAGQGSGGSIYIRCRTIDGSATGVLSANGGNGSVEDSAGAGGGRVAVWAVHNTYAGAASVAGGVSVPGYSIDGTAGTIVWGQLPIQGTIFSIR